jgi:hypothetical protein
MRRAVTKRPHLAVAVAVAVVAGAVLTGVLMIAIPSSSTTVVREVTVITASQSSPSTAQPQGEVIQAQPGEEVAKAARARERRVREEKHAAAERANAQKRAARAGQTAAKGSRAPVAASVRPRPTKQRREHRSKRKQSGARKLERQLSRVGQRELAELEREGLRSERAGRPAP